MHNQGFHFPRQHSDEGPNSVAMFLGECVGEQKPMWQFDYQRRTDFNWDAFGEKTDGRTNVGPPNGGALGARKVTAYG